MSNGCRNHDVTLAATQRIEEVVTSENASSFIYVQRYSRVARTDMKIYVSQLPQLVQFSLRHALHRKTAGGSATARHTETRPYRY